MPLEQSGSTPPDLNDFFAAQEEQAAQQSAANGPQPQQFSLPQVPGANRQRLYDLLYIDNWNDRAKQLWTQNQAAADALGWYSFPSAGAQGRGYWEDPSVLFRYKSVIDAGGDLPEWVNAEAIDNAYAYLDWYNDGADWTEWSMPAADDPLSQMLHQLPLPPEEFLQEDEQHWLTQPAQTGQVPQSTSPIVTADEPDPETPHTTSGAPYREDYDPDGGHQENGTTPLPSGAPYAEDYEPPQEEVDVDWGAMTLGDVDHEQIAQHVMENFDVDRGFAYEHLYGIDRKSFSELPVWAQIYLTVAEPDSNIAGRPDWSRLIASGVLGVESGLGAGIELSSTLSPYVGVPAGILIGFGTSYQAFTGEEIKGMNNLMEVMDIGERRWKVRAGMFSQLLADGPKEFVKNIPERIIASDKTHSVSFFDSVNLVSQPGAFIETFTSYFIEKGYSLKHASQLAWDALIDATAFEGEVHQLRLGYDEPLPVLDENFEIKTDNLIGGAALSEYSKKIEADWGDVFNWFVFGQTPEGAAEASADLDEMYGDTGQLNDRLGSMIFDVNGPGENLAYAGLEMAARNNGNIDFANYLSDARGNLAYDVSSGPVQAILGQFGLEGSKSIFKTLFNYNSWKNGGGATSSGDSAFGLLNDNFSPGQFELDITDHYFSDETTSMDGSETVVDAFEPNTTVNGEFDTTNDSTHLTEDGRTSLLEEDVQTSNTQPESLDTDQSSQDTADQQQVMDSDEGSQNNSTQLETIAVDEDGSTVEQPQSSAEPAGGSVIQRGGMANYLDYLSQQTPDTKAAITINNLVQDLGTMVLEVDTPAMSDFQRASNFVNALEQTGAVDAASMGQIGKTAANSPTLATSAGLFQQALKDGGVQELFGQFTADQRRIALLNQTAAALQMNPSQLVQAMARDAQGTYTQLVRVLEQKAQDGSSGAQQLLTQVQSGDLSLDSFRDQLAPFTGVDSRGNVVDVHPWTFEEFRANTLMKVEDAAMRAIADHYGVSLDGALGRFADTLKAAQSMLLLEMNPAYLVNTQIGNWITTSMEGVYGVFTLDQANAWMDRFGIGDALENATLDSSLERAMSAVVLEGDALALRKAVSQTSHKFGLLNDLTDSMKAVEGQRAFVLGMKKAWDGLWKEGVGFEPLPPALENQLAAIDPNLPEKLVAGVRGALNAEEIHAILADGVDGLSVNRAVSAAVEQLAAVLDDGTTDGKPERAAGLEELLTDVGLDAQLGERLVEASTPEQVQLGVRATLRDLGEHIQLEKQQRLQTWADEVSQLAAQRGYPGVMQSMTELFMRQADTRFDALVKLGELRNVDALDGSAAFEAYFADQQAVFAADAAQWTAALDGIQRAWQADSPLTQQVVGWVNDIHSHWQEAMFGADFLLVQPDRRATLGEVQDAGVQTTHVNGVMDWARLFFESDLQGEARQALWHTVQEQITGLLDEAWDHETRVQKLMDSTFADQWSLEFGTGREAQAWRDGANAVRQNLAFENNQFIQQVFDQGLRGDELQLALARFVEQTAEPLKRNVDINFDFELYEGKLKESEDGQGSSTHGRDPSPTLPETSLEPVDGLTAQLTAQALSEDARQVTADVNSAYVGQLNRQIVLEKLQRNFGLDTEQMEAVRVLMNLYAEQWARESGRLPQEWYGETFADIIGDDGRVDGFGLNQWDNQSMLDLLTEHAEPFVKEEFSAEYWHEELGGLIETPIGAVKLGENQLAKLVAKHREGYIGLIKPTLEHPMCIVNDSGAQVFIKPFVQDGKTIGFVSVTIERDGMTISISSHRKKISQIKNIIERGDVLYDTTTTLGATSPMLEQSAASTGGRFDIESITFTEDTFNPAEVKGAVSFLEDGRAILRASTAADVTTVVHELGHIFRRQLTEEQLQTFADWVGADPQEIQRLQGVFDASSRESLAALKQSDPQGAADVARYVAWEEQFARGFERFLAEEDGMQLDSSLPPLTAGIRTIFRQFANWIKDVYRHIKGSPLDVILNDGMRDLYRQILGLGLEDSGHFAAVQSARAGFEMQNTETGNVWSQGAQAFTGMVEAVWDRPTLYLPPLVEAAEGVSLPTALFAEALDFHYDPATNVLERPLVVLDEESNPITFGEYVEGVIADSHTSQDSGDWKSELLGDSTSIQSDVPQGFRVNETLFSAEGFIIEAVWQDVHSGAEVVWVPGRNADGSTFEPAEKFYRTPLDSHPRKTVVVGLKPDDHSHWALFAENGQVIYLPKTTGQAAALFQTTDALKQHELLAGKGWIKGAQAMPLSTAQENLLQAKLKPLLGLMESSMIAQLDAPRYDLAELPQGLQSRLKSWLTQTVAPAMNGVRLAAKRKGETAREAVEMNYQRQYNTEMGLVESIPYALWYTSPMLGWARENLDAERWGAMFSRQRRLHKKVVERVPARLRGKVQSNAPYLPEWAGNLGYRDPLGEFAPQFLPAAENAADANTGFSAQEVAARMLGIDPAKMELPAQSSGGWSETELDQVAYRHFDLAAFSSWNDYYIDRQLANRAVENPMQVNAILDAMTTRQGSLYNEANAYVQGEMTYRIPGFLQAEAVRNSMHGQVSAPDALASVYRELFPSTLVGEGELKLENLTDAYQAAWKEYCAGDAEALNSFFREYPEYQDRLALVEEPEERLRQYLVRNMWNLWSQVEDSAKAVLAEQLPGFQDGFLEESTRDYTAFSPQQLANLAGTLRAAMRSNPLLRSADPFGALAQALTGYPPAVNGALADYWREKHEQWPNIEQLEQWYYTNGMPEGAEPMLEAFWAWRDDYYDAHPEIEQYEDAEEMNRLYEEYPKTMADEIVVYLTEGEQRWAALEVEQLQEEYFELKERSLPQAQDFLRAHPVLAVYWQWQAAWRAQSPGVSLYVDRYGLTGETGNPFRDSSLQNDKPFHLTPTQLNAISPSALTAASMAYHNAGTLGEGTRTLLRYYWEEQGRPGGSFEEYVEEVLRRSIE